ncbi:MAG: hypothetical protein SGILL_008279, partial [Bacillariaceae sp.]
ASNPAWLWAEAAPQWLSPYLHNYNHASFWLREHLEPLMIHLGCYQTEWLIFAGSTEGYTDYRWYANVNVLKEGDKPGEHEQLRWATLDFHTLPWWIQKRHQRGMLFFTNIGNYDHYAMESKKRLSEEIINALVYDQGVTNIPGNIFEPDNQADIIEILTGAQAFNLTLEVETSMGPALLPSDLGPWE